MTRLEEMVEDVIARSTADPVGWEIRDGALHLICPQDGQSMFRVGAGLAFNLGAAAVHVGAHLRQCHDN